MTSISPVGANNTNASNYNAVKIQVNDPRTNIPEGFKSEEGDNGVYNAVNIEVNRPRVNAGVKRPEIKPVYNYPNASGIVTYDMAGIAPVLPVAYQTNLINNRTLINAEIEFEGLENKKPEEKDSEVKDAELKNAEIDEVKAEAVKVPEPNVTTVEAEKSGLAFHGKTVEIVPPQDIKPDVDVAKVVANLSDKDYDVQATQMEEIARISMENPQNAVPFVVKEIFMSLIDVVQKDTSNLTPPSPEQINARKKIIVNELIKEQAKTNGEDLDKIELPYTLTDAEKKSAATLTDMEQAERNKEYALYTMAALAKVYTDEVFKHTGNVVPMTDLPGVSTVVDTLRYNQNSGVKIAAIDALRYIRRPEYKDELISLFSLAARDENPYVAKNAIIALASMEDMK